MLRKLWKHDSTLLLEKVWKPTLLIYNPNEPKFDGGTSSEEIVSTVDIYSILIKILGIKEEMTL